MAFSQTAPLPTTFAPNASRPTLQLGTIPIVASLAALQAYPPSSAAGNKPAEGIFVIRPPPSNDLPPISSASAKTESADGASEGRKSKHSSKASSGLVPTPPAGSKSDRPSHIKKPSLLTQASALHPVPPPPTAQRSRPVNHFILKETKEQPQDADAADGEGKDTENGDSSSHLSSPSSDPFSTARTISLAEEAAIKQAEQSAREAAEEAEAARLRAEAREKIVKEKQARSAAADAAFIADWKAKEENALSLLLQFLASAGGRSLLSQKPAHGFIVDDPSAFREALKQHMQMVQLGGGARDGRKSHTATKSDSSIASPGLSPSASVSSSSGTVSPSLLSDFTSLLYACDHSPLMALWILEKWRLKGGPAAASSSAGQGGMVGTQEGSNATKQRGLSKFSNIGELITGVARARSAMVKEQKEWLAYLTHPGMAANPTAHAARSLHKPDATPLPPIYPLFPSDVTRTSICLSPHMDALWIYGAGHAAFSLVRQMNEHEDSTVQKMIQAAMTPPGTATAGVSGQSPPLLGTNEPHYTRASLRMSTGASMGGSVVAAAEHQPLHPSSVLMSPPRRASAGLGPVASQFESFAAFLDLISVKLRETKHLVREGLKGMQPMFIEETLFEVLTNPTSTGQNALPRGEYVYNESNERVVGLKSQDAVRQLSEASPAFPPRSPSQSMVISGTDHYRVSSSSSIAHTRLASSDVLGAAQLPLPPSTSTSAAGSRRPSITEKDLVAHAARMPLPDSPRSPSEPIDSSHSPGQFTLDAEIPPVGQASRPISAKKPVIVVNEVTLQVVFQVNANGVVTTDIVYENSSDSVDAASQAGLDSPLNLAALSNETPVGARTPVTVNGTASHTRKGSVTFASTLEDHLEPSTYPPSMSNSLPGSLSVSRHASTNMPVPVAASSLVILPPIPSLVDLLNLDALSAVLHLSQGYIPAMSYLRCMCYTAWLHSTPPITKLSWLLTCLQARSRDFHHHLDSLCTWFEAYGHDLIRSLNQDLVGGVGADAGGSAGKDSALMASAAAMLLGKGGDSNAPAASTYSRRMDMMSSARAGATAGSSRSASSSPLSNHDYLSSESIALMYFACDSSGKTLRYITQLYESKKRFHTLGDLVRRIRKINAQNQEDYVLQRSIVKKYLATEEAILFRTPSNAHSPLTFSLNTEEHVDMFLNRCMIPTGREMMEGKGTQVTPASAGLLQPPNHSHHRSVSAAPSITMQKAGKSSSLAFDGAGGNNGSEFSSIPPNWNKTMFDHASGGSIVRHLEYIIRQRRQQIIQEHRRLVELSAGGLGVDPDGAYGTDKVIQPLLFHDINSLLDYVMTLAIKAKGAIEEAYVFIASASSSLLISKDDPTYASTLFSNPQGLTDFSQASSWSIHDAKTLFETCLAGHDLAEYAQRVSDAKLVHLHRCLDHAQHLKTEGRLTSHPLPPHPLMVPCNGEPLEGLRGCSFHFPDHAAVVRTLNTLYMYDVAMEIARHAQLEEQVRVDQIQRSQPKSQQEILLAWLQREENTLLTPQMQNVGGKNKRLSGKVGGAGGGVAEETQSRADLVKSLTISDMERLMQESGGGENTLVLLQGLQKDGKTYPNLQMLIGAVAYALNPELQPKEGVSLTHSQLMELLLFLSGTNRMGASIFSNRMFEVASNNVSRTLTNKGSSAASSKGSTTSKQSSTASASAAAAKDAEDSEAINPLDLDAAALLASGDPIAPHLYGVSLNDIQVLVGYAFGIENLLGIIKDLLSGNAASSPSPPRKFHSWKELRQRVISEIKLMNPYRSWMGLPASVTYETYQFAGAGGPGAGGPQLATGTQTSYENRAAKDVYDFLFNTNHSGPTLASSSSTSKTCRLLPNNQLKIPVQKTDAAVLLRYAYCEELLKICDPSPPGHQPGSLGSKSTLFILHNLNDPTPRFKTYGNLPELMQAVKKAKAETNDELIRGVDALGDGAREIYSYLQSSGASVGNSTGSVTAVGADLPGMQEKMKKEGVVQKERLELSTELLASLVEAGGLAEGAPDSSSAVASTAPPPALTILSHLSLLGEEYSKGQGEQLVAKVRAQKAAAEAVRRALAENIKQMKHDDDVESGAVAGGSGVVGSPTRRNKLLKVVPPKIAATRDKLAVGIEDTLPRLLEIRPFIHTNLPASLISISALVEKVGREFAVFKEKFKAYQEGQPTPAPATGGVAQPTVSDDAAVLSEDAAKEDAASQDSAITSPTPQSSQSSASKQLYETIAQFLSLLQELFVAIPGLSKRFNEFFLQLQPLHTSIHSVYSAYYPLYFYLQHYLKPTPHPFFQELLPPLTESVSFLGQLRMDTSAILNVQQSLTFVLEKLSPSFTEIHQVLDDLMKHTRKVAGTPGHSVEEDPVVLLASSVADTDQYLLSLLPFLSSMFQTNEHYLPFLNDLIPFFESQLRPLLPPVLPLLIPVAAAEIESEKASGMTLHEPRPAISRAGSQRQLGARSSASNPKRASDTPATEATEKHSSSPSSMHTSPNTRPAIARVKSIKSNTPPTLSVQPSMTGSSSATSSPNARHRSVKDSSAASTLSPQAKTRTKPDAARRASGRTPGDKST